MARSPASKDVVRFASFEVDLRAGELRKSGLKLHLQELPFRILSLLLERPSEVVTREELRERLWPADTFVEFEHCLNTAVNKLRTALNDSADIPLYIEILPRRGYRFIAVVEGAWAGESPPENQALPLPQLEAATRPTRFSATYRFVWVAGGICGVAGGGSVFEFGDRQPRPDAGGELSLRRIA